MIARAAAALLLATVVPAAPAPGPMAPGADVAVIALDGDTLTLGPDAAFTVGAESRVESRVESGVGPVWQVGDELAGPGWDTTGVPTGAPVRWSLTGVDGPGQVAIGVGGTTFDSADGLPDTAELPAGGRGGTRWTLTAPGSYRLAFTAEATLPTGEPVTATSELTVDVAAPHEPASPEPTAPGTTEPARAMIAQVPRALRQAPRAAPRVPAPIKAAPVKGAPVVLAQGHADIAGRLVGDALRIQVKDGTGGTPVWREPSTVVFHARPAARIEVPDDPAFAFLGKGGDPVWALPQVQDPALLWPGWNTEELGSLSGDIAWKLTGVDGPGAFALFTSGAFGDPEVHFNSRDGLPDTLRVARGTHAHGNWVFGKEGVYRLTFEMSGTKAGKALSDRQTVTVAVGAVDPSKVTPSEVTPPPAPKLGGGAALPRTGTGPVVPAVLGGAGLLGTGAVLLLVARRRRVRAG